MQVLGRVITSSFSSLSKWENSVICSVQHVMLQIHHMLQPRNTEMNKTRPLCISSPNLAKIIPASMWRSQSQNLNLLTPRFIYFSTTFQSQGQKKWIKLEQKINSWNQVNNINLETIQSPCFVFILMFNVFTKQNKKKKTLFNVYGKAYLIQRVKSNVL
jgi:hypothetical protein